MYFDKVGKFNTEQTLQLACKRGNELNIDELVVASTYGDTVYHALEIFDNFKVTAVTYHSGFKETFKKEMTESTIEDLKKHGVNVICATHALSGIERSIAKRYGGVYPVLLIADTLKLLGQGTKVAVEVAIMAADAGSLSGKDIIAVGGTKRGADTALVLKPAHQNNFFDMRIREVICKPRDF